MLHLITRLRLDRRASLEACIPWNSFGAAEVESNRHATLVHNMVPAEGNVSQHPYYPIGVALSGGAFIPNEWSVLSLVYTFAVGLTALLLVTFLVAKRARPYLSGVDQALVLWFVLSKSCLSV